DFDTEIQDAGGENNAFTTSDVTNYYDILPAQNIETAFWLESDRMVGLKLTEESVAVQKQVVIEEFKQRNLNRPYGDASAIYRRAAYKRHPYRNLVIGERISHIANTELDDIKRYYHRYYAPDNAVVSVVGNIDFEHCVRLTEKWFGSLEPSGAVMRNLPVEPQQRKARLVSVKRNVPADAIYKVYHICGRGDKDYPYFDIISDILANGKSSRLYTNLVSNRRMFSSVDAAVTGDIDAGLLIILGRLNPGVSMYEADKALISEISILSKQAVSDRELLKVVNKFESAELFENIGAAEFASRIAFYELLGDASAVNRQIEIYRNASRQNILDTACKYLTTDNCTTLYYNAVKYL
ncbi:MAG: pitrilysin family protein, partial [Bacteroidales bacterium]